MRIWIYVDVVAVLLFLVCLDAMHAEWSIVSMSVAAKAATNTNLVNLVNDQSI